MTEPGILSFTRMGACTGVCVGTYTHAGMGAYVGAYVNFNLIL